MRFTRSALPLPATVCVLSSVILTLCFSAALFGDDAPPPATPFSPVPPGLELLADIPLTEEQKNRIRDIHARAVETIDPLQKQSRALQKENLRDRKLLQDLRRIRLETFQGIRDVLAPAQREEVARRIQAGQRLRFNRREISPFEHFDNPLFIEHLLQGPDHPSTDLRAPFQWSDEEGKKIPGNLLDQPVFDLLAEKKIEPAAICSDAVFIRRVFLDLIGTIPTVKETVDFLNDPAPDKRARLVDTLLERPEYVEYWSLKWGDTLRVKAEFPINLWPNGAMVYHRWIRESIRTNKSYDRMSRELLLGSGSNFRQPPANFYRAVQSRDAASIAEAVALTFLGSRLETWPEEKQRQLAAFFSRVGYKGSAEWKEEIVYWIDTPLENPDLVLPDGTKVRIEENRDPREAFADWLIDPNNPRFARCIVNRLWFWIFGRGIVHLPDDFRADNPPSNPALLDTLAAEFVRSNYDMKRLLRLIVNSRTYQLSSIPRSDHPEAEMLFAHYPTRQIDAEVLMDMFRQILGFNLGFSSDVPEPFTNIPDWRRTIMLADGSITHPFLETFGRPSRDSGRESDRNLLASTSQRMFLINSSDMMSWIENSGRLRNATNAAGKAGKPEERRTLQINYLWLTAYSRYPTVREAEMAREQYNVKGRNENAVYQDIVWMLLNTKEFLCRH